MGEVPAGDAGGSAESDSFSTVMVTSFAIPSSFVGDCAPTRDLPPKGLLDDVMVVMVVEVVVVAVVVPTVLLADDNDLNDL